MKAPIVKKSTANQRNWEHNMETEKYIQWVTTLSLAVRVYLHPFSCVVSQISEMPRNYPRKFELIAVQGQPRSSILVSIESTHE